MRQSIAEQERIHFWTIQPWTVWEHLEAQATLTVDPRYSANLHNICEATALLGCLQVQEVVANRECSYKSDSNDSTHLQCNAI
jgi:hypothetical protein